MIERTRKIAGCDDGTCPEIRETSEPSTLAVQGRKVPRRALRRMRHGRGETVVLIPEELIDQAAQARGWRR